MGTVHSFSREFYERFAKEFVDVYEKDGPISAANMSFSRMPADKYPDAKPYVVQEFLSRGYTFPEQEEEAAG